MAVPQAKRKYMIAFALVGFYISSSVWLTTAMVLIGACSYLSIIFDIMQQLPPLAPPPKVTPKRTLHFVPGADSLEEEQRVRFVIQQDLQKSRTVQQTSTVTPSAPNPALRVKM